MANTSLMTDNPELASQWDYEKNAPLTPDDVAPRSTKRVWWIGTCGHQWMAQISERNRSNRKGSGCPICNKNSRTSLQEQTVYYYIRQVFPDAINSDRRFSLEFDIFIPSINTAIEYDGYMWHTKDLRDTTDEKKNRLCVEKGIRLIRILEPKLPLFQDCICLQRDNMTDGCLETIIEQLCDFLTEGEVKLSPNISRDRQKILSMYETASKENSLQALRPDIAIEWHPTKNGTLKPENLTVNSGQKVWWSCSTCGYEWEGSVHARTNKGRKMNGCPVCAGTIAVAGLNDFASAYPELAKEWHPTKNGEIKPDMITRGSHRKIWWLGKCGHEWEAHLHHRIAGSGCPYCTNKLVLPGFNDLITTNPELVSEWDPDNDIQPSDVVLGSEIVVSWICPQGHKYQSPVCRRKTSGCPYCAGQRVLVGFNDISTTRPDLTEIWHPLKNGNLTPQSLTAHTNKKIWFVCKKGHEWEAVPNSMRNNSCPYCSGRKLLPGFNDLKTVRSDLIKEWDFERNVEVTPEGITYKSTKKVWWKCSQCGNQWEISAYNRSILNSGCPECGKRKRSLSRILYWENRKNTSLGNEEDE